MRPDPNGLVKIYLILDMIALPGEFACSKTALISNCLTEFLAHCRITLEHLLWHVSKVSARLGTQILTKDILQPVQHLSARYLERHTAETLAVTAVMVA